MAYDPDKDPEIIALRKKVVQSSIDAQAKADRFMKDDKLASAKGDSPEQIEARKRVMALYFELHMPHEPPNAIQARLDKVDYTQPVTTTNGRAVNMENPKGVGRFGFGRKPAYFVSLEYAPKTDQDPIYAVEYFPLQK